MWTFNVSDTKPKINEVIDNEYKKYDNMNHYNGQLDCIKPVVAAIVAAFERDMTDYSVIDVAVSENADAGRTGISFNVVIH